MTAQLVAVLGYLTIITSIAMIPFLPATRATFHAVVSSRINRARSSLDHFWREGNKEQCAYEAFKWFNRQDNYAKEIQRKRLDLMPGRAALTLGEQDKLRAQILTSIINGDLENRFSTPPNWPSDNLRPEWRPYALLAAHDDRWYLRNDFNAYWQASCMNVPVATYVKSQDDRRRADFESECRSTTPANPALVRRLSSGDVTCADVGDYREGTEVARINKEVAELGRIRDPAVVAQAYSEEAREFAVETADANTTSAAH